MDSTDHSPDADRTEFGVETLRLRSLVRALLPALAVAALTWLLVFPWLRPDFQWKDVADAPNHLVRIYAIDAALARGEWFPRWLADLYLGYGYPLLNYYAPSTYYVAAALHRLGMTVYGSFQWTGALSVAVGAGGAYALVMAICRRLDAALLAAVVFAAAPYPFITNLYVRGAVPEALALALLPWLLAAAWDCWRRGRAWCAGLAVLVAELMLTHNVSALIGMGLLAVWVAATAVATGGPRLRPLVRTVTSVAAGLGLSAFFWVPALAESSLVQIRMAQGDFYDPRSWLFDPLHVALGVTRKEYPHTRLGPADLAVVFDYHALGIAAPEKPSLWQLLLWVFAITVALVALNAALRRRRHQPVVAPRCAARPAGAPDDVPGAATRAWLSLCCALVALVCWFMNTIWSKSVWGAVPLATLAQFPWRLYGPLALALACSVGLAVAALPARAASTWVVRAAAVALAGMLTYGSVAARPVTLGPEPAHDIDGRDLAALEYNRYGAGTTSGGEFLPTTVHWEEDKWVGQKRGIRLYEDAYPQASWQAGLARVLDGTATITGIAQQPNRIVLDVEATTDSEVGIHQLVFPGWRGYVDGEEVSLRPAQYVGSIPESLGFITMAVPAGHHRVDVRFGPTRVRAAATALSAAVAMAACLWLVPWSRWGLAPVARRVALVVLPLTAATVSLGAQALATRPLRSVPPSARRVALDVAGAVSANQAVTAAPNGDGHGALPPYLDVRTQVINGQARRWLYLHPPAMVTVPLHVPAHAYFQARLALDPETWATPTGDGVRFILEAEVAGGRVPLLDRLVNPRAQAEDRSWIDVWASLKALEGQDVRLVLRTDPRADTTYDWAGWADPQVVIWDASRPLPAEPHQW